MLGEMKKKLSENIDKAKDSGDLTAQQVYDIAYEGVIQAATTLDEEITDLRIITKEAVIISIQALVEAEEITQDKITAALHGAVDGVKQVESSVLNSIHNEMVRVKKYLNEEQQTLAESLRTALEGAREAADSFTGSVKDNIETAVTDAKLKSADLLGLTRYTVKQAVFRAIENSEFLEDDIINIARDATANAMAEAHFSAERIHKVSETVLLSAVEAAEEIESHISETASAATEGVRQGLSESVEFTQESIAKAGRHLLLAGNLEQLQEDLGAVGDLFAETLRRVADKSGKSAKEILLELADDSQKVGSTLREKALLASHTVAERLEELGKDVLHKTGEVSGNAAHALTDESKKLGMRMLVLAKNTATEAWDGAKIAFYKGDNEKINYKSYHCRASSRDRDKIDRNRG